MGKEKYLTFVNMEFNELPCEINEHSNCAHTYREDMHKIGVLLAKLISKKCGFTINNESMEDPLLFYKQIH